MKKLLFSAAIISLTVISCGQSSEEKDAAQQENEAMVDEKVDEIMESLNESAQEAMPASDSTAAETEAEHDHDHSEEGHTH